MRVLQGGHAYELENVGGDGVQIIQFVEKRDRNGEILPENQWIRGILSQELLRVLIDRTLYLNAEAPCDEDTEIVECLRRALCLYESRAARRTIEKLTMVERARPCPQCGHILCRHKPHEAAA